MEVNEQDVIEFFTLKWEENLFFITNDYFEKKDDWRDFPLMVYNPVYSDMICKGLTLNLIQMRRVNEKIHVYINHELLCRYIKQYIPPLKCIEIRGKMGHRSPGDVYDDLYCNEASKKIIYNCERILWNIPIPVRKKIYPKHMSQEICQLYDIIMTELTAYRIHNFPSRHQKWYGPVELIYTIMGSWHKHFKWSMEKDKFKTLKKKQFYSTLTMWKKHPSKKQNGFCKFALMNIDYCNKYGTPQQVDYCV